MLELTSNMRNSNWKHTETPPFPQMARLYGQHVIHAAGGRQLAQPLKVTNTNLSLESQLTDTLPSYAPWCTVIPWSLVYKNLTGKPTTCPVCGAWLSEFTTFKHLNIPQLLKKNKMLFIGSPLRYKNNSQMRTDSYILCILLVFSKTRRKI